MRRTNKYVKHSRIGEYTFRRIVKCFSLDLDATRTAKLCNINRNTVNRHFNMFRCRIAMLCENNSPLKGTVEADESYFGAKGMRGRRGRGAGGKTKVFAILKREDGTVYTEIIPDSSRKTLQKIISGKVEVESIINTDGWKAGACPHENGGRFSRYRLQQTS